MTYPIRSVPDGDTAWGGDIRSVIAGVNDHQTRLTAIENLPNVKGDLMAATADNAWSRLAVGTDGQVLTASSAATVGLAWSSPSSSGGTVIDANTQTGTTYTLVLADAGKVIEMNNAAANTLTVPPNSSVPFPVGTVVEVAQYGAGQTTIAQGAGVTIRTASTLLLRTRYSAVSIRKRATDEWWLSGDSA